jgi:predicted acylesterase/phospholipase RssA
MYLDNGLFNNALVLGGGGAKRVAYSGALDALELNHFELVVGTSEGAVIGLLIALGVRKDHIQYFCEHDMVEMLSLNTIKRYQDNGPVEALLNMAQDLTLAHCNHSTVLRELLQYEISSRLHQLYLFLYQRNELPSDHQFNNIEIYDQTRWLAYQDSPLVQQQIKGCLSKWIRKPQDLNFTELAWLRERLVKIGLNSQLKRLIVTAVQLNSPQASTLFSGCFFGDGENTDIKVIDAVMASHAFVGINPLITVPKTTKSRYVDGGIFYQCPTFLALKHLRQVNESKVVSLNLADDHQFDSHPTRLILGLVDWSMLEVVNRAFKTQLGMELDIATLQQSEQLQQQLIKSAAPGQLIEINLKPVGIDTLTMVVHPAIKQLTVQRAKAIVRRRLAALAYMLTPADWVH